MSRNPAFEYVERCCKKSSGAPKYVRKQCKQIKPIFDGKDKKYKINEKKLTQIEKFLSQLRMPKGLKMGQPIAKCLSGFQWLLIVASLCVVYRENPKKRRYTNVILEIARKNGKTFIIAVLFILLFFVEPKFSYFYSVAPDGSLSREVKKAIGEIINFNADVFEVDKKTAVFKVLNNEIRCNTKKSVYVPLNYSNSRLDGKLPNVFLCDEVGALPNSYAFEAMRSGQLTILNKLGFLISTKYNSTVNPFEDEVELCKKILDGKFKDEETFSLLFEPDDTKNWRTDIKIIKQANPLTEDVPEMLEELKKKRKRAIANEKARENFLTKHLNIIYQGLGTESFVSVEAVRRGCRDEISFEGKLAYIGVDLAMTNDNCAVAICALDDDNRIIADAYSFIPEGRLDEKCDYEKIDYRQFIRAMKCIACGDMTVGYDVIEDFVFQIEEKYGCEIYGIGYDRYNALSSAQKWDKKYETVQIRQHSDTLHPPTKLLYEKIVNGEFLYEKNKLLEINFENARCTFDTNMNRYVNKKKSNGKVDMVVAMINAVYLLQQDVLLGEDDWGAQIA